MSEIDWHGIGLLLIGAWQAYKELRQRAVQRKAAKHVADLASEMGPLADKLQRDLAPVFAKAAKIGAAFQKHTMPLPPPPADLQTPDTLPGRPR